MQFSGVQPIVFIAFKLNVNLQNYTDIIWTGAVETIYEGISLTIKNLKLLVYCVFCCIYLAFSVTVLLCAIQTPWTKGTGEGHCHTVGSV